MKINQQEGNWVVTDGTNFLHKSSNGPRQFGKPKKVKDIILYPSYGLAEYMSRHWLERNPGAKIEEIVLTLKSK